MKRLFVLLLLSTFTLFSCKEPDVNSDIPFATLAGLAEDAQFRFRIKSSPLGKYSKLPDGKANTKEYLVVINDDSRYRDEILTQKERPFIDFSTHTLLALGLEYRGAVNLMPRKDGDRTILTVVKSIPTLGPQGVGFGTFSAVVPKVDSAKVEIEVRVKHE